MEKQKLFFNKKDGQFGVYYSAKITIDGKDYWVSVNEEVKSGKFGEYRAGTIQEAKQQEKSTKQDKKYNMSGFKDDTMPF